MAESRADLTAAHDAAGGTEREQLGGALAALDEEIASSGVRGNVGSGKASRRVRSTRRRQDVVDLPRRPVEARTVGRAFTSPDGKTFRPSLFVTLTLPSYGRVRSDGTPVDPSKYDYRGAARDALHFSKLVDRFIQNLRRFVGFDVQYFAAVEPQRCLAPHIHLAIRGTVSRAELRQVAAATYHQVWWPSCDEPVYDGDAAPIWDAEHGAYVDADGNPLPSWDEALDALDADEDAEPVHVARFGVQVDVRGVLVGSPDARRCIGYLTKYLNKSAHECHEPASDAERAHVDRLMAELRYEPCSPSCANWLRYGVQPKNARDGMRPGHCKAKAHRRTHLGYGGRRVLVSRKWSGKSLADHKHERRAWVLNLLGELAENGDDPTRYVWEHAAPSDPDVPPVSHRLLRALSERIRWRTALDAAKAAADGQHENSATRGRAA